uniref:Pentatricopeptide repeat-containing protein n=1 Tax=Aegilops tauschii subsp. strangulata TaxID=200361 RepID=A0A453D9K8_AEGTS
MVAKNGRTEWSMAIIRSVARDMRGALSCVEEMKAEGIGLTIVTYSILISGFGKINDAQSADNLFKEAKTNLADLNGIIYSNIIHAHCAKDSVWINAITKP